MTKSQPSAATLRCRHCGAPFELRGGARTQVIVCAYCDSATDLTDPDYKLLWRYTERTKHAPTIPLGSRGTLRGEKLECIGFMRRSVEDDGERFSWSEYLLYNPFNGYRWLVEGEEGWSLVKVTHALPTSPNGTLITDAPPHASVTHLGVRYTFIESATAQVDYALGEFYWQVAVGQLADLTDYKSGDKLLSAEVSDVEIAWSAGTRISATEVRKSFRLPEEKPSQPPLASSPSALTGCALWAALFMWGMLGLILTVGFSMRSKSQNVFKSSYEYMTNARERSMVTAPFTIQGSSAADLDLVVDTTVNNRWAGFHLALLSEDSDIAYDGYVDISFYTGIEDGERWGEGSPSGSVTFSHVPPGSYRLFIEPESGTGSQPEAYNPGLPTPGPKLFDYTVKAISDVTLWSLYGYAMGGLFLLTLLFQTFVWLRDMADANATP